MRQSRVRDLPQRGLGVERHTQSRGVEHIDVVGTVTDGDSLFHRHTDLIGELAQRNGLRGAVDDFTDHTSGQLAVDDLEGVGVHEVQFEFVCEAFDDLAETAGHHAAVESEAAQGANRGARPRRQFDALCHLVDDGRVETGECRHTLVQ